MTAEHVHALPLESAVAASIQPCLSVLAAPALPSPTVPKSRVQRKAAWLGLQFTAWPMAAVLSAMTPQQREQLQARPFAVIDHDRKRRVLVCNEPARLRGLRCGHGLNAAIALCSELEVAARDLQREVALLDQVARECQRYTSTVSLEPPSQLLLEVRGSLRLFGGPQALIKTVCDDFAARDLPVSAALTPTARSALWLSRSGRPVRIVPPRALPTALMQLPIGLLRWPQEITLRLARFGVTTLADLRRLPRGGLARRIGAQHLNELDAAFGRRVEPRRTLVELPCYYDRVVLEAEIETTGLLEPLIAARLLLLERFLRARTLSLSELVLELRHRARSCTTLQVGLALPSADMNHLQTLIRERLMTLQLPAPIVELRLHATHMMPARCRSRDLLQLGSSDNEELPQRLARLVETLESRLGKPALRALQVVADHRPEHARAHSVIAHDAAIRSACQLPEGLPPRPLWLLDEPAEVQPRDFSIVSGPESIEAGWWDGKPCRREYFLARAQDGALCWVFRDLAGQIKRWYLHGRFG